MNSVEFWKLYDSGKIQCKVFEGSREDTKVEVTAFEHEGKFFLRITKEVDGKSSYSNVHHRMTHTRGYISTTIREFSSKAQANKYFKMIFEGCSYKKVQG